MAEVEMKTALELHVSGDKIVKIEADFVGHLTTGGKESLGYSSVNIIDDSFIYRTQHKMDYKDLLLFPHITEAEEFVECLKFGRQKIEGKIAILERIVIPPHYRGKGLFRPFLGLLLKGLKENLEVDYLFLKPYPIEGGFQNQKQFIKDTVRLENLYAKCGFRKFQLKEFIKNNYGIKYNYMYTKLSDRSLVV